MAETLYLRLEAAQAIGAALEFGRASEKAGGQFDKLEGALGRFGKSGGGLFVPEALAATKATDALGASHGRAAVSGEGHRLALNRITNSLESLAVGAAGANSQVASIATKFLEFGTGGVVTAGVLAGLAAITVAWEKLTEESRKQREEQEKSTASLVEYYRTLDKGGEKAKQLADALVILATKQREANRIIAVPFATTPITAGLNDPKSAAAIAELQSDTARRQAELTEATRLATLARDRDIASMGIALERQRALNAASGASELTLKLIAIRYDAMAEKLANAQGHTEAQTKALNQMTDEMAKQKRIAAELADAIQKAAFATAFYQNRIDGLVKSLGTLAVKSPIFSRTDSSNVLNQGLPTGPRTARIDADHDMLDKAIAFEDDLRQIFFKGWQNITADGLKSWSSFFDEVGKMTTRLFVKMSENPIFANAALTKALGLGSAGIAGGFAGYAAGQSAGSAGSGALSGAASGALAGAAFGPWGAAIGGLVGLTTGLIGGAKAARERAEAEHQLQVALEANLVTLRVQVGTMAAVNGALYQNHAQFEQLKKQIEDAYSGRKNEIERNKLLAEAIDLEKKRNEQLEKEAKQLVITTALQNASNNQNAGEDYYARILSARGFGAMAADARFASSQRRELDQATADFGSGRISESTLAMLKTAQELERIQYETEKQTQILKDQLQTAQDAQDTAQQLVDETQRTQTALKAFGQSLLINPSLSPLSPDAQYREASKQLDTLFKTAKLGDKSAANQFQEFAANFLGISHGFNASSTPYVQDFTKVQDYTQQLVDQYGMTLSIQQDQLTEAKRQTSLLQAQLNILQYPNGFRSDIRDSITGQPVPYGWGSGWVGGPGPGYGPGASGPAYTPGQPYAASAGSGGAGFSSGPIVSVLMAQVRQNAAANQAIVQRLDEVALQVSVSTDEQRRLRAIA